MRSLKERYGTKELIIIASLMLCAIALIGIGYANFASYTSGNNGMSNDYVTLNMTDSYGNPIPDGVMFDYQQDYDTYTDKDNNTVFRLNTDTDKIRLNPSTYKLLLNDSRTDDSSVDRKYTMTASMAVPELYEDDEGNDRCNFVLELKGNGKTYRAVMTSNAADFKDINGIDDNLSVGEYDFNVYIQMVSSPDSVNGSLMSIPVDKEKFVDRFETEFKITFRAGPEST